MVSLVGKGNALYILMSGRLIDADEALRMGLLNQVTKPEELESVTYQLAGEIAALAPLSHAANKRTLNQVQAKPGLDNLTQEEMQVPLAQFDTKDYQERLPGFPGEASPQLQRRVGGFIHEYPRMSTNKISEYSCLFVDKQKK